MVTDPHAPISPRQVRLPTSADQHAVFFGYPFQRPTRGRESRPGLADQADLALDPFPAVHASQGRYSGCPCLAGRQGLRVCRSDARAALSPAAARETIRTVARSSEVTQAHRVGSASARTGRISAWAQSAVVSSFRPGQTSEIQVG